MTFCRGNIENNILVGDVGRTCLLYCRKTFSGTDSFNGFPDSINLGVRAELIDRYHPDIFVCGHSHILKVVRDPRRNMLVINPGAAGIQGFHVVRTALRFKIEDGRIHSMEVFELDR
jgi:hypothetical protein